MNILIVESNAALAAIWARHLERMGHRVDVAGTADDAVARIAEARPEVILINLVLEEGSALGVADYARIRCPDTNIVFVTDTRFFSDGSIFNFSPNARALVKAETDPDDLAAIVEHYGRPVASAAPVRL
ncbi:response regulator [Marivivens marinus]|uniref:response regulator n=1 Tax=Marivivens marinus TaxID=3110173 RepID=UPI003B8483BA